MDTEYPDNYTCPITLDLMLEPVKASDNKIYDKAAIIDWFKKNKESPLTREELSPEFIKQNELQKEIIDFINKNNIKVCPYSPVNKSYDESYDGSEESNTNSLSDESSQYSSSDLIYFNCSNCNDELIFSFENGRTVCSRCGNSYKINQCQNCDSGYIIRENASGNYRCRECYSINIISRNRNRRRNNECSIM
tara:strand:- start:464 stop:1042 length:579 start_codon:yes stop_codon:yes gene_type:complete